MVYTDENLKLHLEFRYPDISNIACWVQITRTVIGPKVVTEIPIVTGVSFFTLRFGSQRLLFTNSLLPFINIGNPVNVLEIRFLLFGSNCPSQRPRIDKAFSQNRRHRSGLSSLATSRTSSHLFRSRELP